jgi:putative ABC transport system permease protein
MSLEMPRRFLRGSYARLSLTVAALACGVALVCAMDVVNRAVYRAFTDVIDTMAGRAALQVSPGESGLISEELAARVRELPDVELAVPVVGAVAFLDDGSGERLTVHGIDLGNDAAVRVYAGSDASGVDLDDPLFFLSQPDSVALTRVFAERRGLHVDDRITLETPTGKRTFTVRGLLAPEGIARIYGGALLVMDLYAAEAAFTKAGFVNRIDIVVGRGADVETVRARIAAVLPPGLRVDTPAQRKADLHRVMSSLQFMLQAAALIGLIAAFLIAFNHLAAMFEARTWQVGVLRAVGMSAAAVRWELLKESVLLGLAGAVFGVPLGVLLGRIMLPVIATTTALNYKLFPADPEFAIRLPSVALAIALGLAAAILAAVLPSRRVVRLDVAEVLRGRGMDVGERMAPRSWRMVVVALGGAACAVGIQSITRDASWGFAATGLLAVGAAVAARPLVSAVATPLVTALRWVAGPIVDLVAADIAHKPRRAGLTVAVLGVGVGFVFWLWLLGTSFERSVIAALAPALRGDLVVTSSFMESGAFEAPMDEAVVKEVGEVPGVLSVAAERVVDWHHGGGPIVIEAFDAGYFRDSNFGQWPLHGESLPDVWGSVARGEATVVSSSFVQHLGARVGDTLTLDTPSGVLPLRIAGVTTDFASPRGTLKLPRHLYQRKWNDSQITLLFVRVAPGFTVSDTRAAILARLGERRALRVLSSGELVDYYALQVRRAFSGVHVLAAMILLVVLLGIADALAAAVLERRRELGMVRAVGLSGRHLRRMVLLEGLVLAGVGLLVAGALGATLGVVWVKETFPYLLGWMLELHVPSVYLLAGGALTLLVGVLGASLPARRAARIEPALVLRYE